MISKKLRSKKGISLPVAMAITAVLVILSSALITIALTSIVSTSSSVNSRQAYLNVKSALEYAYAYYGDTANVPDLTKITDEYMVMLDKEGGTTNDGAKITTKADTAGYVTYVKAKYLAASTERDVPALKLTAFSKSSDAFGHTEKNVQMSALFTLNKLSSKNRVTLTDLDMSTDVTSYDTVRDAISLHVKQYPGENWTPFFYTWSYLDWSGIYRGSTNCYGLESGLKNATATGSGNYTKVTSSSGSTQEVAIVDGFNNNEHKNNTVKPSGIWNNPDSGATNSVYKEGPTSSFTRRDSNEGENGWYDATYYIYTSDRYHYNSHDDEPMLRQVNYFNIIIAKKGAMLNSGYPNDEEKNSWKSNKIRHDAQSNEMFHLWFLNNSDRNIYFEFLQPGLIYRGGSQWNGTEYLNDRILVYVNNQKTTVHFKVKGIGDTREEAVNPTTNNPVITNVIKNGESIINSASYNALSEAVINGTAFGSWNSTQYEDLWKAANLNGKTGQADMTAYFYTADESSHNMLYEGCGWWVSNIGVDGYITLSLDYYDKNNNPHSITKSVTGGLTSDVYLVVDPSTGKVDYSTNEDLANFWIDADTKSYTTIRLKSSSMGSVIAPYLDYHENDLTSTERRLLLEAIEHSQEYSMSDYEETSYNTLKDLADQGITLYNSTAGNAKAKRAELVEMTNKINDAIKALRSKVCSPDTQIYQDFAAAVKAGMEIEDEYNKEHNYDGEEITKFLGNENLDTIYKSCKALYNSNDITDKTEKRTRTVTTLDENGNTVEKTEEYDEYVYSSSAVFDLTSQLNTAINTIRNFKFDKQPLKDLIKEAETQNQLYHTVYDEIDIEEWPDGLSEVLDDLDTVRSEAQRIADNSTSKTEVETEISKLQSYLDALLAYSNKALDTVLLSDYINQAKVLVNSEVTTSNYTDETHTMLETELASAEEKRTTATAQSEIDKAAASLKTAIDNFTVVKPNNTCEQLVSENKIRVWVKGANAGTVIKGVNRDGKFENYEYTVTSFDLIDESTGFGLNGKSGIVIDGQDITADQKLTYFDIDANANVTGFKLILNVLHNKYDYNNFNAATGTYPIIATDELSYVSDTVVNINDVTDGNVVIDVKDLSISTVAEENKTKSMEDLNPATDLTNRIVHIEKQKMCEYYISNKYSNAEVEVFTTVGENTTRETHKALTLTDVPYSVVRFVYSANQTASVKALDTASNAFVTTMADATVSGQRIILFDSSTRNNNLQMIRFEIPYNVPTLNGDDVVQFYVESGGTNYAAQFNGEKYVFEINFNGAAVFKFHRQHMLPNGTLADSVSNDITVSSPGLFEVQYTSQTNASATGRYTIALETPKRLIPSDIYPKYSSSSGSGNTSGSGSSSLNGIVSDKLVNSVLGISDVSSSTLTPFDYFGQSGAKIRPTTQFGWTIIWIDTSGEIFQKYNLSTLKVYCWATPTSTLNETTQTEFPLTASYPGDNAMKVGDTDYYYCRVKKSAYACILSAEKKNGGREKIGSSDLLADEGHIYFDMTDIKSVYMDYLRPKWIDDSNTKNGDCYALNYSEGINGHYTTVNKQFNDNYMVRGYKFNLDQYAERKDIKIVKKPAYNLWDTTAYASLFEVIDNDVLTGVYYKNTKYWDKDEGYVPDLIDEYCNSAPGKVVKHDKITYRTLYKMETNSDGTPRTLDISVRDSTGKDIKLTDKDGGPLYLYKRYDVTGNNWYESADYYYRAKAMMSPPYYDYSEPEIDTSDMTATNLRMVFVGGTKIRLENYSYFYSYGDLYAKGHTTSESKRMNDRHNVNISSSNPFGGSGGESGNMDSEGRIGDTTFSMIYDWFEYKIPVDKSNTYNIQFSSVKYNGGYVAARPEKNWSQKGYKTDSQYTTQIQSAYGDIFVKMTDATSVKDGRITGMNIYTCDPETSLVKDNQDIYVRLPSGWNNLQIQAHGMEDQSATYTSGSGLSKGTDGLWKCVVPANTPFLDITAVDANGHSFNCSTAIQSNAVKLFDPTFNVGTGGWDSYETSDERIEKELYALQSIYSGYVLPKNYDINGFVVQAISGSSYDFPEGLSGYVSSCFTNGYVNDTGRGQDYGTIHNLVAAFKNLYGKLSEARAYIPGRNYPEYIHNESGTLNLFSNESINSLRDAYDAAAAVYKTSSDPSAINSAASTLVQRISNMTPDVGELLPIIYYDAENFVGQGATFEISYKESQTQAVPTREIIRTFNTENFPIYFSRAETLYDVKFIVNYTDESLVKDVIKRSEGAWVYMALPKKDGQTTAYWVQNSPADYRNIAATEYRQSKGDPATFCMIKEGASKSSGEGNEDNALNTEYRPITLYFKNDVMVYPSSGSSYKIRAGAYTFESNSFAKMQLDSTLKDFVAKSTEAAELEKTDNTDIPQSPFIYKNNSNLKLGDVTVNGWVPTADLYSNIARKFFTDPHSYYKYSGTDVVDTDNLVNWVAVEKDGSGNITGRSIKAGSGFTNSKTVNMTVDKGSFASAKPWNYSSLGNLYFRWENNNTLYVNDNVSFAANEITFASAGKIDGTSNYGKYLVFKGLNGATSMNVYFPTDLNITYIDEFRIVHNFTIREGSYTVSKDPKHANDPKTLRLNDNGYICNLFNEEYWTRMEYVSINNRYDTLGGGYNGSGGASNGRFTGAMYSDITDDDV